MNKYFMVLFVLVFMTACDGMSQVRANAKVTVEQDRFSGVTSVIIQDIRIESVGGRKNVTFYLYGFMFPDGSDPSIWLSFKTSNDNIHFRKCHSLTFLLNGKTKLPTKTHHRLDFRRGHYGSSKGSYIESIDTKISPDDFMLIVLASSVEAKICNAEMILDNNQIESLKAFAIKGDLFSKVARLSDKKEQKND